MCSLVHDFDQFPPLEEGNEIHILKASIESIPGHFNPHPDQQTCSEIVGRLLKIHIDCEIYKNSPIK